MNVRVPQAFAALLLLCATLATAAPPPPAKPPAPASPEARAPVPANKPTPAQLAAASPVPVWVRNGILVEQGGRGLYTYRPDVPGQSRCDALCERLWPPHYAHPEDKPHGPFTIARSFDGRPMWAWKGQPLYRWISDRRRGDAGGEGVADVWDLVRVPPDSTDAVAPYFPMRTPRPGERWIPKPLPVPAAPTPGKPPERTPSE